MRRGIRTEDICRQTIPERYAFRETPPRSRSSILQSYPTSPTVAHDHNRPSPTAIHSNDTPPTVIPNNATSTVEIPNNGANPERVLESSLRSFSGVHRNNGISPAISNGNKTSLTLIPSNPSHISCFPRQSFIDNLYYFPLSN